MAAFLFTAAVYAGDPLDAGQRAWLKDRGTITFVSQTSYPPFEFLNEHGNPQGMCIELVQWMAAELGFKAAFRDMPFKEAQDAVLSGRADVLTSLFYSRERDERFTFSEMTWEVPALIFVRAERPDISTLKDLEGKRIAMQRGDYAAEFLASRGISYKKIPTDSFAEATDRVIAREADAVIGDRQIVLYHLYSHGLTDKVKSVGAPLYIGSNRLAVREGQSELAGILNAGLAMARERGIFERITRKWLGTHYGLPHTWLQRHARQLVIALAAVVFFSAFLIVWGIHLRRLVIRRTRELFEARDAAQPFTPQTLGKSRMKTGLWILAVLVPLCAVGDYILRNHVILPDYLSLENQQAKKTISSCIDGVKREMHHLEQISGDWAKWDDTYRFVQDANPAYVQSNFQWESLTSSGIHLISIYDLEGRLVWGGAYDPAAGKEISLGPFSGEPLAKSHLLLQHPAPDNVISGVTLTERGPILLASRPILTSAGEGPIKGVLVMGRFLGEETIRQLSHQKHVPFNVKNPLTDNLTDREKTLFSSLSPGKPSIEMVDGQTLKASGLLADLDGNPALLITATLNRKIFQQGKRTAGLVSGVILTVIVVIGIFLVACSVSFFNEVFHRQAHIEALIEQRTAALQESELKFRELADLLPQTIFETDSRGRLTYANRHAFQAFGYTRNDFEKGLKALDMLIPDDRGEAEKIIERILANEPVAAKEFTALRKDGTTFPTIIYSSPICHGTQTRGIRGIMIDITERKRMETQLKRNLSFSRSLLNAVPTPVFYKDREGKYLGCNQAFSEFMGTTSGAILGKTVHDLWPASQAAIYDRKDRELMENPVYQVYDLEITDRHGRLRSVIFANDVFRDERGDPAGIVGAFLDITERTQIDKKIRSTMERRQREAEVVATIAMSEYLARGEVQELVRQLNETAAGVLGVERVGVWLFNENRTELINVDTYVLSTGEHSSGGVLKEKEYQNEFAALKSAKYIDADDPLNDPRIAGYVEGYLKPNRISAMLDAVIRQGGQNLGVLCFEHVDTPHHWDEDEISFVCQLADQVALAVVNCEYRRMREEKSLLEEQYRQSQKVEAIGRLAGGVAHDLNNLLSPILGYAELLLNDPDQNDANRKRIEHITHAANRARDLVHQLLAFSRKQILEYKSVDLNKTVAEFAKLLKRTIREDIRIDIVQAPRIRPVRADIGQIEQVILNLAVNAQDAMPDGGILTISIDPIEIDESNASTHPGVEPGEYVMLAISDTGHGMDDETLKQIFEPFFSTKGNLGTGLGLATAYGIVKQHGGNIRVYSKPGMGTTFTIYLPAAENEPLDSPAAKKIVTELKGTETVLLVEDDRVVRELAENILHLHGYDVLVAEDSASALEILKNREAPVHLMLTDVVMPGMNGSELYNLAVKHHPGLKVLYMSGYPDDVIAHRGVLNKGVQFIQKPFTVRKLAAKIREVLEEEN